jgi:uncharacterized membrane protein YbhN (UPF0104 family)
MQQQLPALNNSSKKRVIKKVITILFYALIVLFLALYLAKIDFSELHGNSIGWGYIIAASVLGLVSRYLGAYTWLLLLKGLGARELRDIPQLIYVYAKSWLGRYIPGTAPWILGKIYFVAQMGVSKKKLAVGSFLEGGLKITVTIAIAILLMVSDARFGVLPTELRIILIAALLLSIASMLPPVFNFFMSTAYRLLRKKTLESEHLATSRTVIKGVLLYGLGALLNGLALFFIVKAVHTEIDSSVMLYIMGASSLAAAVSMLVVFVPSGLGVREGIQLVLLGAIMPLEIALIAVVVTRLWSVAMDFVFFGLSKITTSLRSRDAAKV